MENKKGAIRAICWNSMLEEVEYYFIPAHRVRTLSTSSSSIRLSASVKTGVVEKLQRYRLDNIEELSSARWDKELRKVVYMPMFGRKTFDPRKLAKYNTTDQDVLDDRRQTVAQEDIMANPNIVNVARILANTVSPNLSSKLFARVVSKIGVLTSATSV